MGRFILTYFIFVSGCTFVNNSNACREMCPIGVKSFDGKACTCMTPDDLKGNK